VLQESEHATSTFLFSTTKRKEVEAESISLLHLLNVPKLLFVNLSVCTHGTVTIKENKHNRNKG
jgi:hypothetical protein